jgi:hypothetical protein
MKKIARESYPQVELLKQVRGRNADRADVCSDHGRSASDSLRVAGSAVFWGCALGAGTPARASRTGNNRDRVRTERVK